MDDKNIEFIEQKILNCEQPLQNNDPQEQHIIHKKRKKVNYQNDINDYIKDNEKYIQHLKGDCICLVCNCGQCKCGNRHSYKKLKSLIKQSTTHQSYKLPEIIQTDLKTKDNLKHLDKTSKKYLFTETTNKVDYQQYFDNYKTEKVKIHDNIDNKNQYDYKQVSIYMSDYKKQKQIDRVSCSQDRTQNRNALKELKLDSKTQYMKYFNQGNKPLEAN